LLTCGEGRRWERRKKGSIELVQKEKDRKGERKPWGGLQWPLGILKGKVIEEGEDKAKYCDHCKWRVKGGKKMGQGEVK